ncbi:hypothetical protein ACH4UM_18840 [Streptomyces sp. NPDC020801]|uniref:hypothetical protein n=1 Tax=Streptomyces sp. NPDC020801 TaxID=3365093 RepID=UPI0037B8B345
MGTNYYVHTPACANACEHCSASEELHLGKSSMGWRFCFQAEPDWPHEQAYSLWLQRAKSGEIRDEYGEPVTLDGLLALIEAKQDGRSHTDYTGAPRGFLYDSMRNADFDCDGYDFCDRYFT